MAKQVTLYIEDTEIKLLVTNGQVVEKWASMMLDSGVVADGVIQQEETVAASLRSLMEAQGLSGSTVTASLSGLNSIFRLITLPEVPKNILEDAIQSEAARVIPVPMDQVYLARQLLSSAAHENRYFLVAYPKNATDSLVRTIQKAGLSVKVMDVAPLSLVRCVHLSRAVVVNTWLSNIDIVILVDRVPEVIRSFPLPAETLTDAERVTTIAEEISRTVTFYNASHTDNPLTADIPILLSGELARETEVWPTLSGKDGRPVELLTFCTTAPEGFEMSQFMVNLGMTVRSSGDTQFGSIINLNALPAQYLPKGISLFNILAPVVGIVLIGALVYGWFYIDDIKQQNDTIQPQIDALQMQVAQSQAQLAGLRDQTAASDAAVNPIESKANALETELQSLREQRERASGHIRNAWRQLPPSTAITLDTIDWDGATLTISGTATGSESNVFDYAAALRGTLRFGNVVVSEIVKELTEDTKVYIYHFTLTLL
ncbi:type IV pilus biogenesis protein PilM [Dehalogenimonas sp. WBC-2]|nr:type IV pilus biogenesis protein PilM [Dehalogenimonas sp. WBC-2]